MTVRDLKELFDYSYWANQQLFRVLSTLSDEQFTSTIAGSYGSIRNTMVHILSAEWGWLDRCGGHKRGPALNAADYPTLASLTERWQQVEQHVREFLSTLRDEDLDRNIEFQFPNGPKQSMRLGDAMHHAVIHAAHHRGQVSLLLRMLGAVPGNFDLVIYQAHAQKATQARTS